jgi:uncharacterized protein (DUF2062 family)
MSQTRGLREVVQSFVQLLRQGLTPKKLAFTIALGITLGVTPVLGSTVLLCTLAAIVLQLNPPAIQIVNWLVYPLQLALLVPFLRAGVWMFGRQQSKVSLAHVVELVRTDPLNAVAALWTVTMHALMVWLAFGTVATVLVYLVLVPVLRRMQSKVREAPEVGAW